MIEKVIVKRALKADRFYLPGEVLFPPFSPGIVAEIKAGRGILDIYSVSDQTVTPPVQPIDHMDRSSAILFRKFEPLGIPNKVVYKPRPLRGTSPPWFLGRYAPKKRKLLLRKFDKMEG